MKIVKALEILQALRSLRSTVFGLRRSMSPHLIMLMESVKGSHHMILHKRQVLYRSL
jgi:hypothetical protein